MYIKKLFNQSLLYGIGSSFTSLVSFLILPVYTRLLSVQDFGKLSLILTAIFLLQYIYNLGIYSGFMIRYFDFKAEDDVSRRKLCSTIFIFYLGFCFFASLFIYLFLGPAFKSFIGEQGRMVMLFIVLISSCEILFVLPTVIMRLEEKILMFVLLNFLKSFALLLAVFCALRFTPGGINAALLAQLSVAFCAMAAAYLLTRRHYFFIFDMHEFKKIAKIGLPFLIVMLSFWLIDSANKFMIKHFLTFTEVGLYSLGFKIGQVILFTLTVFQLVWQPTMFKIAADDNAREVFGRIFNYFILIMLTMALLISLFARDLVLLFSTKTYVSSYGLVPVIVFAYAFYGLFYYLQTPLIIKKRTIALMWVCVGGTLFNIIANLIAIPMFGITGAAYATAATYLLMACAVFLVSQKVYRISYDMAKTAKIVFTVFFIFALSAAADSLRFPDILSKVTLVLLFFIALFFIRFFDKKDTVFLTERVRTFFNYGRKNCF